MKGTFFPITTYDSPKVCYDSSYFNIESDCVLYCISFDCVPDKKKIIMTLLHYVEHIMLKFVLKLKYSFMYLFK